MGGTRAYRVFFPVSYAASARRYPVIYWFHGFETSAEVDAYSRDIASYLQTHDALVVDSGPLETTGAFALYLPELIGHIDETLRTLADRDHRGVSGFSAGGFMAFYLASKYPDLVSSASSFMGPTEYNVGPKGFEVEYCADDFFASLEDVRTRLVTGSRDFVQFYHRRLNSVWAFAKGNHETEDFDSGHSAPGVGKTLEFHLRAFAKPLPKPATFTHADPYPNFTTWEWEVASDRRQPGYTILENVSAAGFRSAVREWLPGGAALPQVKLSIESPRLYAPGSLHNVTLIRLRDGKMQRRPLKADGNGRLNFELDGDAYEVGIAAESQIAASGYEPVGDAWVTAGKPAQIRVKFWNKGAARSRTADIRWESSDPAVQFGAPVSRLFGLGPGEAASIPLAFTMKAATRPVVRIFAVIAGHRLPLDVPIFPEAAAAQSYQVADGRTLSVWQHGVQHSEITLGEGDGNGYASAGESFAVLIPDGPALRAAELFSSDPCLDLTVRASDSWVDYDHTGASAKYTLAAIRKECVQGRTVRMLARVLMPDAPNHKLRYYRIEFPIWWKKE